MPIKYIKQYTIFTLGFWVGGKLFIHVYFSSTFNQQRGTQACCWLYMGLEVNGGTRLADDVRAHIIGEEAKVSPIAWISPKQLTRIPHQGGVALTVVLGTT